MVSFDVRALFTSVPVDLAVAACTKVLLADETLAERTPLEVQDVCELLEFCLSNTYFTYRKQCYKQIHGTAMGASISVTTANLVMERVEQKALADFAPAPKIFVRYVDNCFCILNKNDAPRLLRVLNSIEAAIQFTAEYECDSSLPFLDVQVGRTGNKLSFAVHRKATHTGHYLNFNSCHPACHKQSVVSSLVTRATRICSSDDEIRKELQTIHRELMTNGYPKKFIKTNEDRVLHPRPSQGKSFRRRAGVPYVPGVSEALSRIFSRYDLRVAHMPSNKLRNQLVNVKDRLDSKSYPGVVYKIPCADCSCSYIGETGNFTRRLKEHRRDVCNNKKASNALAEHADNHGHCINWDNATIIAKEKNPATRLLLESVFIQTTEDTINRTDGNLPASYTRSLRHILV